MKEKYNDQKSGRHFIIFLFFFIFPPPPPKFIDRSDFRESVAVVQQHPMGRIVSTDSIAKSPAPAMRVFRNFNGMSEGRKEGREKKNIQRKGWNWAGSGTWGAQRFSYLRVGGAHIYVTSFA